MIRDEDHHLECRKYPPSSHSSNSLLTPRSVVLRTHSELYYLIIREFTTPNVISPLPLSTVDSFDLDLVGLDGRN